MAPLRLIRIQLHGMHAPRKMAQHTFIFLDGCESERAIERKRIRERGRETGRERGRERERLWERERGRMRLKIGIHTP